MKLHRFIGEFDLSAEHLIVQDAKLALQLSRVLRLKSGDKVVLCDGKGAEAQAVVRSLRPMSVSFNLEKLEVSGVETSRIVALYCSILKRENFELVAQKATEIGVRRIVPIITARTVKQDLKAERLTKIILEAAEQSGRVLLPALEAPISFKEALEQGRASDQALFFHPSGKEMCEQKQTGTSYALYIGPEGGWDDAEVDLAKKAGCAILSLGSLILRAETAALVATYAVIHSVGAISKK